MKVKPLSFIEWVNLQWARAVEARDVEQAKLWEAIRAQLPKKL